MTTAYHAKLFAHEITAKSGEDSPGRIARALHDAKVDMNPHQVNAALFALKNPLSQGVILADEVGLGKTIEAGLLISQFWAEGKRSILIVAPKSLRHQWKDELEKLFFLSSEVLSGADYRKANKDSSILHAKEKIVITNEHFVDSFSRDVKKEKWDLIVIDEAHKLRNVWRKPKNQAKRAKNVRDALRGFYKVLLTATPMQNNLMELFGLVSFIDDHILGTSDSFALTFSNIPEEQRADRLVELRHRMRRFFNRELRQNVREYIQYTNRNSVTFTYEPLEAEEVLRLGFENYLRRPVVHAIPASAMPLLKLIYLKLLASSTFALKNSLLNLYKRLVLLAVDSDNRELYEKLYSNIRGQLTTAEGSRTEELEKFEKNLFKGVIDRSFDGLKLRKLDVESDLTDDEREISDSYQENDSESEDVSIEEQILHPAEEIEEEASVILSFITLSRDIAENKKADSLVEAIRLQFKKAKDEGWPEKAVIFTEFRTTQNYIMKSLEQFGLNIKDDVAIFNGDSGDVEQRKALVDDFKSHKKIFLTTEAGAEGLNLQFCNLLINYDMPWNPQRVEQRIGRCHRYGQKFDVVVVNFVNRKNSADIRVLELLQEKFNLFRGAFGASDEVLGQIESGYDFEKEILKIYLSCRSPEEINSAFAELTDKLKNKIDGSIDDARRVLLENFDEEVQSKLKVRKNETVTVLDEISRKFSTVVSHYLAQFGIRVSEVGHFEVLEGNSFLNTGRYSLNIHENSKDRVAIRTNDKNGSAFIQNAISFPTPVVTIEFDVTGYHNNLSLVESRIGQSGLLTARVLKQDSLGDEQSIVLAGFAENGDLLDEETISKIFKVSGTISDGTISGQELEKIEGLVSHEVLKLTQKLEDKNKRLFHDEIERLDAWAEDIKLSLELEIKQLDLELKMLKNNAKKIDNLEDKVQAQRQVKSLESKRNEKRKELFVSQDRIDQEKEEILSRVEKGMNIKSELTELFTIRWKVV